MQCMTNLPSFDFVCADTEDNSPELLAAGKSGFDKQLTQAGAITAEGAHWHCVGPRSGLQFIEWFVRMPQSICYFHNLQYDLGNLFGRNALDIFDVTLVGNRMIRAVWHVNGRRKVFLDSYNIWPMAVKKIAPAFGLKKLKLDVHSKAYLFGDIEIIHRAMCFSWRMCLDFGLEKCPATLGGLCVALWKLWGGENVHDTSELSRAALFGGRVELFRARNTCLAAHTDINSLYPAMMLKDFPGRLAVCNDLPELGIADVTVAVPKCEIAPLPFRREDGSIMFPYGKFRGTWTIPEIINACNNGTQILKVHAAMGTSERCRPYSIFVKRLYQLRLECTSDAHKLFYKLLMNNLYGRLGTTGLISRSVLQTERNRYDGVPYGNKVLVQYQMPLAEETNWSHAAYVTGYGRLELQRYLRIVGATKMIYCDTDSVFFDFPEAKSTKKQCALALTDHYFEVGQDLGKMKLEAICELVQVWAPKVYRAGRKWKAKGVPIKKAREFIETRKVHYDMPFRFREAVAFYDAFDRNGNRRPVNSKQLSVWRTIEKRMITDYDRKYLIKDRFFPCKITAV